MKKAVKGGAAAAVLWLISGCSNMAGWDDAHIPNLPNGPVSLVPFPDAPYVTTNPNFIPTPLGQGRWANALP